MGLGGLANSGWIGHIADMTIETMPKARTSQELVDDAREIGVSRDEVRQVRAIIKSHRFPADVQGVEVKFGRDWTEAPAAWIEFLVEDDLNPSKEKIARLNDFANVVRRDLLKTKPLYWPYVGFRAKS